MRKYNKELEEKLDNLEMIESFEPRCYKWWTDTKERAKLLEKIKESMIPKKEVYDLLYKFYCKNKETFPKMKVISDNISYDFGELSLEFQIHGKRNSMAYLRSRVGREIYDGFGLDSNDFAKGLCASMETTRKEFYKNNDTGGKLSKVLNVLKSTKYTYVIADIPLESHCALYDAAEIGTNYLTCIEYLNSSASHV